MTKASELLLLLKVKSANFVKGISGAQDSIGNFGKKSTSIFSKAQDSLKKIGVLGSAAIGATLVMGIRKAIKEFSEFERSMAFVSTMVKDTEKWMGTLTKGVENLSIRFGQSTSTITTGLYDILSAGVPAGKSLEILNIAGETAVAGFTDLSVASRALVQVINAMGYSFDEASKVSDIMFAIVREGITTFQELANNMAEAVVAMSAADGTFEDLAASYAILTQQGINSARANVALARAINDIENPADEALRLTNKLGLAFGKGTIEARGFVNWLEELAAVEKKMPGTIEKLFKSDRALKAIRSLIKDTDKLKAKQIEMYQAVGERQDAYAKAIGTFSHRWDVFWAKIKKTLRDFGAIFVTILDAVIWYIDGVANIVDNFIADLWGDIKNVAKWLGIIGDETKDVTKEIEKQADLISKASKKIEDAVSPPAAKEFKVSLEEQAKTQFENYNQDIALGRMTLKNKIKFLKEWEKNLRESGNTHLDIYMGVERQLFEAEKEARAQRLEDQLGDIDFTEKTESEKLKIKLDALFEAITQEGASIVEMQELVKKMRKTEKEYYKTKKEEIKELAEKEKEEAKKTFDLKVDDFENLISMGEMTTQAQIEGLKNLLKLTKEGSEERKKILKDVALLESGMREDKLRDEMSNIDDSVRYEDMMESERLRIKLGILNRYAKAEAKNNVERQKVFEEYSRIRKQLEKTVLRERRDTLQDEMQDRMESIDDLKTDEEKKLEIKIKYVKKWLRSRDLSTNQIKKAEKDLKNYLIKLEENYEKRLEKIWDAEFSDKLKLLVGWRKELERRYRLSELGSKMEGKFERLLTENTRLQAIERLKIMQRLTTQKGAIEGESYLDRLELAKRLAAEALENDKISVKEKEVIAKKLAEIEGKLGLERLLEEERLGGNISKMKEEESERKIRVDKKYAEIHGEVIDEEEEKFKASMEKSADYANRFQDAMLKVIEEIKKSFGNLNQYVLGMINNWIAAISRMGGALQGGIPVPPVGGAPGDPGSANASQYGSAGSVINGDINIGNIDSRLSIKKTAEQVGIEIGKELSHFTRSSGYI